MAPQRPPAGNPRSGLEGGVERASAFLRGWGFWMLPVRICEGWAAMMEMGLGWFVGKFPAESKKARWGRCRSWRATSSGGRSRQIGFGRLGGVDFKIRVGSLTRGLRLFKLWIQMKNSSLAGKSNLGVFHVSCWLMGLIAFFQLMSVGVALALKPSQGETEVSVVKKVIVIPSENIRPVEIGGADRKEEDEFDAPPLSSLKEEVETEVEEPIESVLDDPPAVLDPKLEKLLLEAREARVRGDMYLAHAKLSEAEGLEPDNSSVLYGLGANYEAFGVFDKAIGYFLRVYQAGPKAGSYYEKAAIKLAHGFVPETKDLAKFGWVRKTAAERMRGGEKRALIVPVEVAPNRQFDPNMLTMGVTFYESIDGSVTPASTKGAPTGSEWMTQEANWKGGEEIAKVWYVVPDQDPATGLLFGEREFYGFVAELYYDGRVIDIYASPRTLLRRGGEQLKMEDVQRELDQLDGLSLEDLSEGAAGATVLPKIGFGD